MEKKTEEEQRATKKAYNQLYYKEHEEYLSTRRKNDREHQNYLNRVSRARVKQRNLKEYQRRANESQLSYRQRTKQAVFSYYSNGTAKCATCEESRLACLSIDHINGGGTQHKLSLKISGGHDFYRWLIRNLFPKGYQVLCMNCQFIKRVVNREYRMKGR